MVIKLNEGLTLKESEPYFGSNKYEYHEDSGRDKDLYKAVDEDLRSLFDNYHCDPDYVSQFGRYERVIQDIIYLYKSFHEWEDNVD